MTRPLRWTGEASRRGSTESNPGVRQIVAWETQGIRERGDVAGEPADRVDQAGALLACVAAGDRHALAELYAREGTSLLRYLLHFTSDRGLAEELLQDTFVAVWKNAGSFEGRSRARAWLFGIARRRACKRLRRREPPGADLDALEEMPASEPEPEAALLAGLAREALLEAIDQLSDIHREVLLLTFVHELSYAEIAGILDVPLGTVKSRLSHAKRALRVLLASGEEAAQ
jgi:RNA polymerase sigma-70 factor (ECF subfamily)